MLCKWLIFSGLVAEDYGVGARQGGIGPGGGASGDAGKLGSDGGQAAKSSEVCFKLNCDFSRRWL